jgi:8-oxo-dGTP pyrophosphatase MutT (NUDIX family)
MGLRAPHKRAFPNCWDILGGHVEPGETTEAALVREVMEEAGVVVGAFRPLMVVEFNDIDEGRTQMHIFRIDAWDGEPAVMNDEHVEFGWFTPDDAASLTNAAFPEYAGLLEKLL